MCTGTCGIEDLKVGRAAYDAGVAVEGACRIINDNVAVNDRLGYSLPRDGSLVTINKDGVCLVGVCNDLK